MLADNLIRFMDALKTPETSLDMKIKLCKSVLEGKGRELSKALAIDFLRKVAA